MGNLSIPAPYILWFTVLLNRKATLDTIRSSTRKLAASITMEASKQTYFTMRFLADRERITQAFQVYAYFRWVDDRLDLELNTRMERLRFVARQQSLLTALSAGETVGSLAPEETMLAELIASDPAPESGLHSYLRHMMAVMTFDAQRRGRLISQAELELYSHHLAVAVTDVLHYLIGHGQRSPQDGTRYAAATAAHIAHMLRDTREDVEAGYFNIPREVLRSAHIGPRDVEHPAYRAWVRERVLLAREQFRVGRTYLSRVESLRCRLAGHTYINRFVSVLSLIERDEYLLRPHYPSRKTLGGLATFAGSLLTSLMTNPGQQPAPVRLPAASPRENP